jgi:hypothetical protein
MYRNGLIGNNAATTAASFAFPRNVGASASTTSLVEEGKESSGKKGLKRFRPKNITLSRDKDNKEKPLPSPNKIPPSGLSKVINASTTSLAESLSSNNSSLYALANPSQTTIIPLPEKGHKHHGLRQKLKLKDKDDSTHTLPLSSAHSTSRPVDINNPQSFYNFAPSSPNTSSFSKSVSGLDLRHGGRAFREKKKEEKAEKAQLSALEQVSTRDSDTSEWPSLAPSHTASSTGQHTPYSNAELQSILSGFGVNNMTPDDVWDFLKAKLLAVFEGENVRIAVEDLNRLVTIHVQNCVRKRDPSVIVGDLEDLLTTGFLSLNHTLRSVDDGALVPHLVGMWMEVFGRVLPFMQAVFLPLDQEFKGRGSVLTSPKLAAEFWGHAIGSGLSTSPRGVEGIPGLEDVVAAGEELEVRRVLLISYRDVVILPRYEVLKSTFSRLSLDSINATLAHLESTGRNRGGSDGSDRPGTAHSHAAHTLDPTFASYNSQASTLLGAAASSGGRSRATSNLSTGSGGAQDVAFHNFSSPPAARPSDNSSAQVTETVGRMLQCLSVLCSVQTGDEAQTKMEELNRQLKLNWLGRGRTGRNRKGFVGTRVRTVRSGGSTIRDGIAGAAGGYGAGSGNGSASGGGRESWRTALAGDGDGGFNSWSSGWKRDSRGSPTPTPTRQGTVSRQGTSDERERGIGEAR